MELNFSAWTHPRTGEERFYINNWQQICGIEIHRYNTGNISTAYLNGEKISNALGRETVAGKIYFTADGAIHGRWPRRTAINLEQVKEKIQPLVNSVIEKIKKENEQKKGN